MATVGPIHTGPTPFSAGLVRLERAKPAQKGVGTSPLVRGGGAGPGHRVTYGPGSVRLAVNLVALFERRKWE